MKCLPLAATLLLILTKECATKKQEILFAVDVSKSINDEELELERDAIYGIIGGFDLGTDKTRIGVISFSKTAELIVNFDRYTSIDDVTKESLVPRPKEFVGTYTHSALDKVVETFANIAIEGSQKIAVVVTDGKSNDEKKTIASANNIHVNHTDITVVVIGVGSGAVNEGRAELEAIATGNGDQNVIYTSSLKSLSEMVAKVSRETCKAPQKPADRKTCPNICIDHGAVLGEMRSGNDVTITCVTGYHLVGSSSLYCEDDGKWSAEVPTCAKNPICKAIPGVNLGRVSYSEKANMPNGTVQFSCEKGYSLNGEKTLTCGEDGEWDHAVPTCEDARCDIYHNIPHGVVTRQSPLRLPGESVKFLCAEGYKFSAGSKDILTCGADYKWDHATPVCEESKCTHIKTFDNGAIKNYGRLYGDRLNFTCNSGYSLEGAKSIFCKKDIGNWNAEIPKCVRNDITEAVAAKSKSFKACPHFNLDNGNCRGVPNPGRTFKCTCDDGFKLSGADVLTCGNGDQKWDKPYPTCISQQCPPVQFVEFGTVTGLERAPFTPGKELRVSCADGYEMIGGATITCRDDGTWSHMPECRVVRCPHITSFEDGRVIGYDNRPGGGSVTFACYPGFKLEGPTEVKCSPKGVWTKDFPKCVPDRPCHAPCLANGYFTQELVNGERIVSYGCDAGYILNGTAQRVCRDKQWDDEEPECQVLPAYPIEECEGKDMDVSFIVDISKSIGQKEIEEERNALKFIFSRIDVGEGKMRVNLITFADTTQEEFALGTYTTRKQLSSVDILKRGYQHGGTRTDEALLMMYKQAKETPKRERVAVILTDGKATEPINGILQALDDTHLPIIRIAMGVGKFADTQELMAIASGSGMENVYQASSFRQLAELAEHIVAKVCTISSVLPQQPVQHDCPGFTTPAPTTKTADVLSENPIEECEGKNIDAVYVVDISKSISDKELDEERRAVRHLLNALDLAKDKSRAALVKYNRVSELEFDFDRFTDRADLADAVILTRPDDILGGTRTAVGMTQAMQLLKDKGINGRKKVIILLTDGKATEDLDDMIEALKNTDITAICIGVGKDVDTAELQRIATGDGDENVYAATNFQDLLSKIEAVVGQVCKSE